MDDTFTSLSGRDIGLRVLPAVVAIVMLLVGSLRHPAGESAPCAGVRAATSSADRPVPSAADGTTRTVAALGTADGCTARAKP